MVVCFFLSHYFDVVLHSNYNMMVGLVRLWCLTPLSTLFQLYREGNRRTWRKPPICRKSLTNFITYRLSWIRTHNVSWDRH
jgi:hypothetical protein